MGVFIIYFKFEFTTPIGFFIVSLELLRIYQRNDGKDVEEKNISARVSGRRKMTTTAFEAIGPIGMLRREDAGKDWVTIDGAGKCNREIELIEEHVCALMINRLDEWLRYDWADTNAFCMCAAKDILCEAGIFREDESKRNPGSCPFNVCVDPQTKQSPCCFTVLADGFCMMDFLDPMAEYVDGKARPPRVNRDFKKYVQAMKRFYQKQKARAICESVR